MLFNLALFGVVWNVESKMEPENRVSVYTFDAAQDLQADVDAMFEGRYSIRSGSTADMYVRGMSVA